MEYTNMAGPFPTFADLKPVYQPPSEAKKLLYRKGQNAIADLRDALFDKEGDYASDAKAIEVFHETGTRMLSVAHQDATACARALADVRMYSTRNRGGALVGGRALSQEDYGLYLEQAIAALDIALARAITSQPEE